MKSFVPETAQVPPGLTTADFKLRMLTINDLVKDYDAVMSSVKHLRSVFGPDNFWPAEDMTLEQDLIDLGWHQKEFQMKSSFAYTVMSPDESCCLGCVYVDPSDKCGYDAQVILWVRQSELENGLDEKLFSAVKEWLTTEWWFERVGFPGREQSWQEWATLEDK
jgi:hypothetical protein